MVTSQGKFRKMVSSVGTRTFVRWKWALLMTCVCLLVDAYPQGKKKSALDQPFQVLYAKNCRNTEGAEVRPFDRPEVYEKLIVGAGGTLAMMHISGFPIEVKEGQIIDLQRSHNKILSSIPSGSNRKRRKYSWELLEFEKLLIRDKDLKLAVGGAPCYDCGRAIYITCPLFFNVATEYSTNQENFHIQWLSSNSNVFLCRITSIFDDELFSKTVTESQLTIDSAEFNPMIRREKDVVFEIKETRTGASERVVVRIARIDEILGDISCDTQSASMALLMAFNLEFRKNLAGQSGHFYRLAAKLSRDNFFQQMLSNYNERQK